jgi:ABC-type transporter Mla maintaining outer membrane lipid asymmetry ATPase subunit MlaF
VAPLIAVRGLRKAYGGLTPLHFNAFSLAAGERAAILGLDAPAAEVLVNIFTGAALPDEGVVRLFGRATSEISDADDWLQTLDRIGMVSPRAMLMEELTVAQSIAMAFTLSLDPVPASVSVGVRRLAEEAGLSESGLSARIADAAPLTRARCRLARALALKPDVLLLEHANALVPGDAAPFGREVRALARSRGLAVVALTADAAFARAVVESILSLDAATGDLEIRSGWRRWLA